MARCGGIQSSPLVPDLIHHCPLRLPDPGAEVFAAAPLITSHVITRKQGVIGAGQSVISEDHGS